MNDELREDEKKALLKGIDTNGPPMSTEQYKAMLIKVFMNQGKSHEEAGKIAEDACKRL